jgi:outer membrane protein TolC
MTTPNRVFRWALPFALTCVTASLPWTVSKASETPPKLAELVSEVASKLPQSASQNSLNALAQGQNNTASNWRSGDVRVHLTHENDQWTGDQDLRTWEAGIETAIALPSQRDATEKLAQSTQEQAKSLAPYLQWEAAQKVRQLVWTLKKAQTHYRFQQKNLTQVQSLLDTIKQRYQAGEAPKIDYLLAQTTLLEQEKNVQQALAQRDKAQANYHYWTGMSQLPAQLTESLTAKPWQIDAKHPKLTYLKSHSESAQAQKAVVSAAQSGQPSVMIGSKHERDRNMSGNTLLLAQISIPLGLGSDRNQRLAEANQTLTERNIALNQMQQRLNEQLIQARTELQTTRILRTQAQKKRQLSKQAMQLGMNAYQAGQTNIQDLLRLRETYFQDQLQARLADLAVGEAIANLNQTLGAPLR